MSYKVRRGRLRFGISELLYDQHRRISFVFLAHCVYEVPVDFFNVIILDSLNISMHTYARPSAMRRCAGIAMLAYTGALVLIRDLQSSKRNNSGSDPSDLTEEGLVRPTTVHMMRKKIANILCICLKCPKGRGPWSFCSSSRRCATQWNYVQFLAPHGVFVVNMCLQTNLNLLALFSCKYHQNPTRWRFLINFWNYYISSAVAQLRATTLDLLPILAFYSYLSFVDLDQNWRNWCGRHK